MAEPRGERQARHCRKRKDAQDNTDEEKEDRVDLEEPQNRHERRRTNAEGDRTQHGPCIEQPLGKAKLVLTGHIVSVARLANAAPRRTATSTLILLSAACAFSFARARASLFPADSGSIVCVPGAGVVGFLLKSIWLPPEAPASKLVVDPLVLLDEAAASLAPSALPACGSAGSLMTPGLHRHSSRQRWHGRRWFSLLFYSNTAPFPIFASHTLPPLSH